ncbi:MAG TPA: hypothetical protein VIX86_00025 [Streptosporangiaceae bacterium]
MSAGTPIRTEDHLRAALVSLEGCAPSADAVLRAVHEAAGRRGPGLARALRSPRSPRWLVLVLGVATAGAAAALTIVLLPAGAPSGAGGRLPAAAGGGLPSAASVGRAMLTAAGGVNGDVLYWTETGINRGVTVDIYRNWSWPAQPVTGQRVITRLLFSQRTSRAAPLKLAEDDGFVSIAAPATVNYVHGRLTVVCYAGTGWSGCGYANTETPPGTWSLHTGRFSNPNPGLGDLSPAALAHQVVKGLWRVTGRTWVDGQRAIALTETPAGHYQPLPTLLWVNARTHLPLRMIQGAGRSPAVDNWYYLKPTKANMALLRVPIPPGYPRSS